MANEKKTSRKKFRVAVSGSTVDGREISPVHLREAAENFNPDVYAARVNVEHYLSPCPSERQNRDMAAECKTVLLSRPGIRTYSGCG
ncbi:Capsid scaffolding protein [Escherichia coli]|nr:Capsid scaffolding protein [Escherichia coli]